MGKLRLICSCGKTREVYPSEVYGKSPRYAPPGEYRCGACSRKANPGRPQGLQVTMTCVICGKGAVLRPSEASKLASPYRCKRCYTPNKMKVYATVTCVACGESRQVEPAKASLLQTQLCRKCYDTSRRKPYLTLKQCPTCGSVRNVRRKQAVSNQECATCRRSGHRNTNWRGGVALRGYPVLWTYALKARVYRRDGYRCGICGKRKEAGIPFAVHHIDYNKDNCHMSNLVLLCGRCHGRTNFSRETWTYQLRFVQGVDHAVGG